MNAQTLLLQVFTSNTSADLTAFASFFRLYSIAAMLDKREDLSFLKTKDGNGYKESFRSKLAVVRCLRRMGDNGRCAIVHCTVETI